MSDLKSIIEEAWEQRADIGPNCDSTLRHTILTVIDELDQGRLRVAEPVPEGLPPPEGSTHGWMVNQWVKKAVLLFFKIHDNESIRAGDVRWFDKVPLKFSNWKRKQFQEAEIRVVPSAIARKGSFIAPRAVLMPCYINIGAYVDSGTMVDTWSTVGSCAQIGKNVHLSGGVGIGGVLEPLQANPVIIEDNCFIGARAEVAEGVIVGTGSVISMGVYLGASTRIVDRNTGEIHLGYVPPYSVVVSGTMPGKPLPNGEPGPNLYCAVIVKTVDERTRSKTGINELLREF
ncbi:MAG: 2,3,4,5-tetrahydropyridine-2,6-dicarboxylate N-succinyltransferase [Magnetococcales bacterium]|nr:2,3,4,5-tetrahydropyridine-2,6-dicarboxylate N-succinyltransferase [Magnetococcales bacterium]